MSFKWRDGNIHTGLARRPIIGGTDVDGTTIFAGRAMHEGIFLPAKIMPDKNSAYVSYNGVEIPVENFQFVSAKDKHVNWVRASGGNVPDRSVATGEENGESLFIGRAQHEGSLTVGKIHPSHGVIYIPFGGQEIAYPEYEVLVIRRRRLFGSRRDSTSSDSD